MANITTANWATFFATTPDNWTFDLTNRVFEFTGDPSLDEDFRFITFDVDFDDDIPATLIIPRISQDTSNTSIRIHNARIIWAAGAATFGIPDSNTFGNAGSTENVSVDIQNCVFVASNGLENGIGGAGNRGQRNTTGSLSNNTFHGINTGTSWFVNGAGIPALDLSSNSYNQTVLHSGRFRGGDLDNTPTVMTGSFDGTTRTNSGGGYTLRRTGFTGEWAYHADCTLAGTGYRTTAGTANDQLGHYQSNAGNTAQIEFSLNNQIESSNYSFQATTTDGLTMYDGYTWNPRFIDTTSLAQVTDVRLTNATVFAGGSAERVFTAPSTVDFSVDIATAATANGALMSASGYIIHTGGMTASTGNRIAVTDKALNFDTGNPRTAHTHNMTAKSYTHNQATDTIPTVVNRFADASTGVLPVQDEGWDYVTEDTHSIPADPLVDGVSLTMANSQNPNTLGGIYQSVKALWYGSTGTEALSNHMSISGASLVLGGGSFYEHSAASRTDAASFTDVGGVRFRSAGTSAIAAGDGLDNIDLNGNSFGILNADTITFPILNSGSAAGAVWQFSNGAPTLVADTSGALEGTLELPGSDTPYQINNADISGLTINATSGTVTIRTFRTTGDAAARDLAGPDVTIEAAPETRSYVVPAQAGNFIVRQTGLAFDAENTMEGAITSSSSLADRTFELDSSDPDSYHIYWKPDSSAIENDGYSITHIGPVTGSDVTTTETVNITNTSISEVLYEFDTTNTITSAWVDETFSKGPADEYEARRLNLDGAASTVADGGTTLSGLLQAANDLPYLDTVAINYLTGTDVDIIRPGGVGSSEIDIRYITIGSATSSQQLVQAITFLDPDSEGLASSVTDTLTVNAVSVSPNPAGITIGEVRTATNEALDTNDRLQETENGIAYMLSDGATSPVVDSRLAGIRPKSANYDPDTDYTTIFDD